MSRAAGDKRSTRFKLDDSIVECLAALPSSAREEDLEDLFYFMAESFQFSGVPLACDETDVDQVVVDLREALEELHGTKSAPKLHLDPDEHTFLVLDQDLQAFPWESLPCLQGRSVSRLPALSFLRDRLDHAAAHASLEAPPHEVVVDHGRTAFVLNPGGDLKNTQKTFEPWLDEQARERAWTGATARAPLEEEVKAALLNKELFLCVLASHDSLDSALGALLTDMSSARSQLLRPRRRRAVHPVADDTQPLSLRRHDALGLLVRPPQGSGRL